jgi:cytochrome c oxidase subunit 4
MADQVLTDEHTAERRPHEEGGQHGAHPTDLTYIKIAILLSVLTAIEVSVSYIKGLELAGNPILLILAVCKFAIVVLFFMHLRFDSRVFRYMFFGGLVLALGVYVAVLRMFHVLF